MLQHQLDSISVVNDSLENAAQKKDYLIEIYRDENAELLKIRDLMAKQARNQWNKIQDLQIENGNLKQQLEVEATNEVKEEEKKTTTSQGKATSNNSNNTTNITSGNNSTNPFGTVGTNGGFGSDDGTASGTGIGYNKSRVRLTSLYVGDLEIKVDAKIAYKLTIDADGNVVDFAPVSSNTTTTDLTLIDKVGAAIKEQVKYNKVEGAPLQFQFYTIKIKAN